MIHAIFPKPNRGFATIALSRIKARRVRCCANIATAAW